MGGSMISVTRFNDSTLIINADLIQTVEETPDTVITLTTGTKFIVKEKSKEIVDKVVEYKRRIFVNSPVNYREQTY
jgi:flagellar protein FlbD